MGDIVSSIFGGGGGRRAPTPTTIMQAPTPARPSPADIAASGALRPELLGAATPAWRAGLAGGTTEPIRAAGGALSTPIGERFPGGSAGAGGGGGGIGTQADDMLRVLNQLAGGG